MQENHFAGLPAIIHPRPIQAQPRINLIKLRTALFTILLLLAVLSTAHAAGQVIAWGDDSAGQTDVPAGLTNVIAVAAGDLHSLALKTDGTVVAWGDDSAGQTDVPPGLTNVIAVAAGGLTSLALRADGTVKAWGDGSAGQTNLPVGLTNVVAIANCLALTSQGSVIAWGPQSSTESWTNIVSIAAGQYTSLALSSDGTVNVWGTRATLFPTGSLSNVVAITDGLAMLNDGTVMSWSYVDCGPGPYCVAFQAPIGAEKVAAVSGTYPQGLVLTQNGTVIDSRTGNVALEGLDVVATAVGGGHYLALLADGPLVLKATIANQNKDHAGFICKVPSRSGRVYRLVYKNSLADETWQPLPLVAGTGNALTLKDSTAKDSSRFYRVRRW